MLGNHSEKRFKFLYKTHHTLLKRFKGDVERWRLTGQEMEKICVGALERVNLVVLLVRWLEAKQFHLGSGLEEPAIRSISCSSACTLGGSRRTLYLCRNPVEFEPSKEYKSLV